MKSKGETKRSLRLRSAVLAVVMAVVAGAELRAQHVLNAGAQRPYKATRTPGGNFLLAEAGTGANDGRVSLLSVWGDRFKLLGGLPSATVPERDLLGRLDLALGERVVEAVPPPRDAKAEEGAAAIQPGADGANPNAVHLDAEAGLGAFGARALEIRDAARAHEAAKPPIRRGEAQPVRAVERLRRAAQVERAGHDVLNRKANLSAAELRRATRETEIDRRRRGRHVAQGLAQHLERCSHDERAIHMARHARRERGLRVTDRPERLIGRVVGVDPRGADARHTEAGSTEPRNRIRDRGQIPARIELEQAVVEQERPLVLAREPGRIEIDRRRVEP
ncbi:MAG: hypothetical protein ACRENN_07925 [Candidatus Eiseniibacteriota bacterium]